MIIETDFGQYYLMGTTWMSGRNIKSANVDKIESNLYEIAVETKSSVRYYHLDLNNIFFQPNKKIIKVLPTFTKFVKKTDPLVIWLCAGCCCVAVSTLMSIGQ